ncbi:anti-sigma factor family protein [Granulicella tundricola]|uniref:Putative anti-sigma factor n=1 Tax=Granulicella tundricola (strain ATCC BAA-1859 / DSM 23138 / MP5ACTX9) TaxID=1198114 RepID=E8X1H1_GRATM|nr:zf-HC2 domain-containing protein [Granulicella tundricola]ADW70206.1 putative anti-sigma factor [Granulicella tundricola MP5ACTX9]
MTPFDCTQAKEMFSGYLDGAVNGREMQAMASHLETCTSCHAEFEAWRGMQGVLSAVGTAKAPEDLGVRLRVAISHENARRQGNWWDGISLRWSNAFRPALLQVTAGIACTVVLVGGIAGLIGVVAAPQAVQANDEPLGALSSPHYLYSAVLPQPVVTGQDAPIVIEAKINSDGRVYDYAILSGPQDLVTLAQIRDQLMVQVYEPARVFGEPVRGRVLITFAGVSVRG